MQFEKTIVKLRLALLLAFASLIVVASADEIAQKDPIDISKTIRAIGTSFESAKDGGDVTIGIPKNTEPGDVLVLYVGGSASGKKMPSRPGKEWTLILEEGKEDLNLKAYYKVAEPNDFIEEQPSVEISTADNIFDFSPPDFADNCTISKGKNTFVSIVSLRGVDSNNPVVDFDSGEDTESGREGDVKAPSVNTERDGVVLFAAAFDDPHQAVVTTKGFTMLLSTDSGTGDGLAIGISPTNGDRTGSIGATGTSYERGGGDDIASTISFRATSSSSSSQEEQSDDELDTNTLFAVRLAPLVDVRLGETSVLNWMILLVSARSFNMLCFTSRSRCPRKKHEATTSVSFMDALSDLENPRAFFWALLSKSCDPHRTLTIDFLSFVSKISPRSYRQPWNLLIAHALGIWRCQLWKIHPQCRPTKLSRNISQRFIKQVLVLGTIHVHL